VNETKTCAVRQDAVTGEEAVTPRDAVKGQDAAAREGAAMPPEGTAGAGRGREMPVFDRSALVERLMGDAELVDEVIAIFIEDAVGRIGLLAQRVGVCDTEGAWREAHALKGAAASVGGEALRQVALEMEKAGRAGDMETLRATFPELERRFAAFREATGG
jgi:HPt (histidine-containing phosphotransfer) domain-containing protein